MIRFAVVAFVQTCMVLASCSQQAPERLAPNGVPLAPSVSCADSLCTAYHVLPYIRTRSKYGIGCMGNVPPGTEIPKELPPESYSVSDIGKPGFPMLSKTELQTVRRIEHENGDAHDLRIAWVASAAGPHHMIVFNADQGPCKADPAYSVLNGTCNEFYTPGESPYGTQAGSGCYPNDPRPRSVPTDTPAPTTSSL